MASLKELSQKPEQFTPGHRACSGCGFPILMRLVMRASDDPVVVCAATGCLEVTSTIYPYTSWKTPFIHSAFENAAATLSGVEAAYRSLTRQGRLQRKINFIAFGGDGGTYDIGLQSLSGAMERGHRLLYICYDNGAYANTGIQRSSATPKGANTTTTPTGKVSTGKMQPRKDLTMIMAAHHIPYAAQAAISHWNDLVSKVRKALSYDGPTFINAMAPCRLSWGIDPEDTVALTKLAVETCFWPLYEVENGQTKINYQPKEKKDLVDWLKGQTRFRHLFTPENEGIIEQMQRETDARWQELLHLASLSSAASAPAPASAPASGPAPVPAGPAPTSAP